MFNFLKFLTDNEVEVATTSLIVSIRTVETVSPVDTHQTDHREEDTDTDTGRTLQLERIEIFQISPSITRFHEYQTVDRRRRFQQERIAQLHRQTGVSVTIGIVTTVTGNTTVLVTSQTDRFGCIGT